MKMDNKNILAPTNFVTHIILLSLKVLLNPMIAIANEELKNILRCPEIIPL